MTAAAVTGPAKDPLPASSVPHSINFVNCLFSIKISQFSKVLRNI